MFSSTNVEIFRRILIRKESFGLTSKFAGLNIVPMGTVKNIVKCNYILQKRLKIVLLHIFLLEFWSKRHLALPCDGLGMTCFLDPIYIFPIWNFDNSNDWASSHALLVKIPNWQKQGALYAKYCLCLLYILISDVALFEDLLWQSLLLLKSDPLNFVVSIVLIQYVLLFFNSFYSSIPCVTSTSDWSCCSVVV